MRTPIEMMIDQATGYRPGETAPEEPDEDLEKRYGAALHEFCMVTETVEDVEVATAWLREHKEK